MPLLLIFLIPFILQARDYMLYLSLFDILGRMDLSQLEAYREV
jgi:hypothetical protein